MKIRLPLILVLALVSLSCTDYYPPEYGIITVQLQNGQKVYFKRVVWGLTGDLFVISASPDLCSMLKPNGDSAEADYVYKALGPHEIYYKSSGDELILYSTSFANPPNTTPFPVRIVQKQLQAIEMIELRGNASTLGLKQLNIEADRTANCR